jgi:hypothetical protein
MEKKRYRRVRAIKLGEVEDERAFVSQFDESGISQPACFKLSTDDAEIKRLREMGFCPIHRHPLMANFLQALYDLLSNEFSSCLRSVDLAKALLTYPNKQSLIFGQCRKTQLEWFYDDYLSYPSELLDQGLYRLVYIKEGGKSKRFIQCKGFSPFWFSL